jgi:hypothetical protein
MCSGNEPSIGTETICGWHLYEQVEREILDDSKEAYFVDKISNSVGQKE